MLGHLVGHAGGAVDNVDLFVDISGLCHARINGAKGDDLFEIYKSLAENRHVDLAARVFFHNEFGVFVKLAREIPLSLRRLSLKLHVIFEESAAR